MSTPIKTFVSFMLITSFAGCASHSTMRGSVAMKISETEAHVCMGNKDVQVGDKVNAFKNTCVTDPAYKSRGETARICKKEKIGTGIITSLLNEHYSIVTFDASIDFNEGTIIEKQ